MILRKLTKLVSCLIVYGEIRSRVDEPLLIIPFVIVTALILLME